MPLNNAQSIDEKPLKNASVTQEPSSVPESPGPSLGGSMFEEADSPAAPPSIESDAQKVNSEKNREDQDPQASMGFKVNDRRFWQLDEAELNEETPRSQTPSFVEQLKAQLEEKDQTLKNYIAAYKNEVVENLEKTKERLERDAASRIEQMRGKLAEPMLEVVDALDRSLKAGEQSTNFEALFQGVKMVHMLMLQKLQELGLQRIETVGKPFDPNFHEAVGVVPVTDAEQNNHIVAELRAGYTLGERLVRAALVQVGKVQ